MAQAKVLTGCGYVPATALLGYVGVICRWSVEIWETFENMFLKN